MKTPESVNSLAFVQTQPLIAKSIKRHLAVRLREEILTRPMDGVAGSSTNGTAFFEGMPPDTTGRATVPWLEIWTPSRCFPSEDLTEAVVVVNSANYARTGFIAAFAQRSSIYVQLKRDGLLALGVRLPRIGLYKLRVVGNCDPTTNQKQAEFTVESAIETVVNQVWHVKAQNSAFDISFVFEVTSDSLNQLFGLSVSLRSKESFDDENFWYIVNAQLARSGMT